MRDLRVQLRIPFATLMKIAFAVLLVVVVVQLWPVILMLTVAVLLAVLLDPLAGRIARVTGRSGAIAVIAIGILVAIVALFAIIGPVTAREFQTLGSSLPQIEKRLETAVPRLAPLIRSMQAAGSPDAGALRGWLSRGLVVGKFAIEGLTGLFLVLAVMLYLIAEGRAVLAWLIGFAPPAHRPKVAETAAELGTVVFAYMRGQAITCTLCGAWVLVSMLVLRVPAAVPLAVLAFFADLVPVVGTIVMTVPGVLLALTISPLRALAALGLYLAYHLIESYLVIPRVYGRTMRLSDLAVLIAVIVGGTLQGAVGAILILPFAAAYPVIERIWLRDRLNAGTVAVHEALSGPEAERVEKKMLERD